MPELLGLNGEQLATIATALGILIGTAYASYRGYRSRPRDPQVDIPKAAIPAELQEQVDDIQNRVSHTERKLDNVAEKVNAVYTDTQVIRATRR